jgi:hypothetical protein
MPNIRKAERRDKKRQKRKEWKPDSGRSNFITQEILKKKRDQVIRKRRKQKEERLNG